MQAKARAARKRTSEPRAVETAAEKAFARIAEEHESDPRVTARKMFGASGLMVKGKAFGMVYKGSFVVKLPPERVEALVKAGKGEHFEPMKGRKMRGWFEFAPGRSARALFEEAKETVAKEPA